MNLESILDLLQWPAMLASVGAAWLVASTSPQRRQIGFWVFLVSNVLWVAWGWKEGAWALITLQIALAVLNIRGVKKTEDETDGKSVPSNPAYSNPR